MSIADNIKLIREKFNLTQDELGAIAGVSGGAVSTWERGTAEPRMGAVQRISDRLNISKADIVSDYSRPLPSNIILPSAHKLPIMGTICAGDGVVCEDDYQGTFIVDIDVKADYCLRVKGDSMIGANIYDGDIVFISRTYDFVQDQIYAVERLDYNEASLKRVTQDGDTLILNPCNSEYHAMVTDYEDVRIIGRCVGVLHKYV